MNLIDFELENDKTAPLSGDATIRKGQDVNDISRRGSLTVKSFHIMCVIIICCQELK